MNLENNIKRLGELTKNDYVVSSSIVNDLSNITENASTAYLSSISYDAPISGGRLSALNIVKFDSLSTYQLCIDSNPGIVTLSDIILIDEENLNAENKTIISVATPENGTDAANKDYVDQQIGNLPEFNEISSNEILSNFVQVFENDYRNLGLYDVLSAMHELIQILSKNK